MGIFGGGSSERSPQDQVDLADLKARVARLEATVLRLQSQIASAGAGGAGEITPEDTWMLEVRDLKARGNVIEAIKVYRQHTGLGLKESKDAVEALY